MRIGCRIAGLDRDPTGIRSAEVIVLIAFVIVWVCVAIGFFVHPLWLVALAVFVAVTLAGALLGVRTSRKLPLPSH
jgi:uncharacterized membrane protein YfcA